MKKSVLLVTMGALTTIMTLGGCSKANSSIMDDSSFIDNSSVLDTSSVTDTSPVMINYSFMFDEATRTEVASVMNTDGISESRIEAFMNTVTQFADTMGTMEGAKDGFSVTDATQPFYDPEYIGETFYTKLGFDDQNCRLTAYTIFADNFDVSNQDFKDVNDSLYGDKEILKLNDNITFSEEDTRKYEALFADVTVEKTTDIDILVKNIQDEWTNRGITFLDADKVQLASIMIHNPENDTVFAGHAGIVFTTSEGYLLVEKLAQFTPFVAAKFDTYEALRTYMLSEVAGFSFENGAEPFIMLNDQLLE